jgi:hypothetical protein
MPQPNGEIWRFLTKKKEKRQNLVARKPKKNMFSAILEKKSQNG